MPRLSLCGALLLFVALPLAAQTHAHTPGMDHGAPAPAAQSGQAAYAAIAEVVARLDADPATDWSQVDLERLRQHLIDMDDVTLRSEVTQRPVEGGLEMTVTGAGRTAEAIRRMTHAHAPELVALGYRADVVDVPGGVRMTVRVADAGDPRAVARIRGLGFIGAMTLGAHHAVHHEALARGAAMAGHGH
ncbi:MAG TPA: hypothetical protein VFS07_09450 [Gemmatimonadales bacterium]|nr:hypothetical protein [Gemmatimonadales bacterium]